MEKIVTKGIVLRATATKEADYILNILTDSLGRIAVVARGARCKGSRIAAGSGTSIQEVNRLMNQFNASKKLMKQMTGKKTRRGRRGGFPFGF